MRNSAMYALAATLISGCGGPPASEEPDEPEVASPAHVNESMKSFMQAMHAVGSGVNERYATALAHLQRHAEEAVPVIIAKYNDLPRQAAMQRWSALYALGELGGERAIGHLAAVALEPLPAKASDSSNDAGDGVGNQVEAEIKLHLRALRGLADNLKKGSATARNGVIGAIKNGPSILREMAAAEYLRGTNQSAEGVELVRSLLTTEERERVLHPLKPVRHGAPPHVKNPSPVVDSLPQRKQ